MQASWVGGRWKTYQVDFFAIWMMTFSSFHGPIHDLIQNTPPQKLAFPERILSLATIFQGWTVSYRECTKNGRVKILSPSQESNEKTRDTFQTCSKNLLAGSTSKRSQFHLPTSTGCFRCHLFKVEFQPRNWKLKTSKFCKNLAVKGIINK